MVDRTSWSVPFDRLIPETKIAVSKLDVGERLEVRDPDNNLVHVFERTGIAVPDVESILTECLGGDSVRAWAKKNGGSI